MYGTISTDETIKQLLPIAEDLRTPVSARIAAYARCAALAYKNRAWTSETEVSFRREALRLAKEHALIFEAFVVLANWLFASTYANDLKTAEEIVQEIEALGPIPQRRTKQEKADFREWSARYKTHRAKYLLLKAKTADLEQGCELVSEANAQYQAAIKEEPNDDHRRVNMFIEWANRLIDLAQKRAFVNLQQIESILESAHRSLDSHVCDMCRAFFFETAGGLAELKGDMLFNTDRGAALYQWRASLESRNESLRLYTVARHHFTQEEKEAIQIVEKKLKSENSPRKIFLSHKGVDKDLVRRFHYVLEELGFQPWLDERELTAGKRIHRDIQRGFKESCACVFFVTESFRDERYIGAEIDFANTEYTERGESEFVVITLAFGNATVPESLRRWVYKACGSELHALLEILRALPVCVGSVHSRKTLVTPPEA